MTVIPLIRPQGHPRQAERLEQSGNLQFVGKRNRDDVGICQCDSRFVGCQWLPSLTGLGNIVGKEGPFADRVVELIEQTVHDLESEAAHRDVVGARIEQRDPDAPRFEDRSAFLAEPLGDELLKRWGWRHAFLR